MDTCAIWMAVQQPVLVLQSFRRQLVKFRTAQINALHRILVEFGETVHKGWAAMERESSGEYIST